MLNVKKDHGDKTPVKVSKDTFLEWKDVIERLQRTEQKAYAALWGDMTAKAFVMDSHDVDTFCKSIGEIKKLVEELEASWDAAFGEEVTNAS
jgi:uridine phosphorylase